MSISPGQERFHRKLVAKSLKDLKFSKARTPYRILLVPDGFGYKYSGFGLASFVAELLVGLGHTVGTYAKSGQETAEELRVQFFPSSGANGKPSRANYAQCLEQFQPTHVFFIGAAINKPIFLFEDIYQRKIANLALWLIQDFYCHRNWAVRGNQPCNSCASGNFLNALRYDCRPFSLSPDSRAKALARQAIGISRRWRLRQSLLKLNCVLGSGRYQHDAYRSFGFQPHQIQDSPFFFDPRRVPRIASTRGNRLVFLGQHSETKGWNLLPDIMRSAPHVGFTGIFHPDSDFDQTIQRFKLSPFVASGQLQIARNCTWGTGAEAVVASSAGVLNPSLWPTTTENVLMESLGLRKPFVCFPTGVHRDYFNNWENGLISQTIDPQELGRLCTTLVDASDDSYAQLCENAHRLFFKLTSVERYRQTLESALAVAHENN